MVIRRWRGAATLRVAWWALAALGVLVLLAGAAWLVLKLPQILYSYVPDPKDRAGAEATTRTGLIAALAGLAALGSLAVTARTYRLSLQGQLTDRYTKAVAQLGDDKLDIRLGGIYALERLAVDSRRDHPTVVEVLSAYVRERTRATTRPRPLGRRTAHPLRLTRTPGPVAVDIQAALTVLGRLPMRAGVSRADFTDVDLSYADLSGANLTGAQLGDANLTHADLSQANLTEAQLSGANMAHAWLDGVNLTKAGLIAANMAYTWLRRANLTEARLSALGIEDDTGGVLSKSDVADLCTDLTGADLFRANLTRARLGGANLTNAALEGANLTEAFDLEQEQLESALGDVRTILPDGLTRPTTWIRSPDRFRRAR